MMGRATLLLLMLIAAAAGTAGADGARAVKADTSLCQIVLAHVNPGLDLPCPRARHEGAFTTTGCDATGCNVTLALASTGTGLPLVAKSLQALLVLGEDETPFLVCATFGAEALACAGETTISLPLESGECVDARARTILTDLADFAPTLPVQADSHVTLCRADDKLVIG